MLLQMSICPKIGLQNVSINSEKWAKLGTLNWTPYLIMSLQKVTWLFMQGFTTKYYLRKAERGDFVVNRQAVTLHTRKTCQVPLRHNSYQTARKRMCEYREEKISCKRLMVYKKGVAAKRKICRGIFFSFGCTMGPECFTKFGKRFSLVH